MSYAAALRLSRLTWSAPVSYSRLPSTATVILTGKSRVYSLNSIGYPSYLYAPAGLGGDHFASLFMAAGLFSISRRWSRSEMPRAACLRASSVAASVSVSPKCRLRSSSFMVELMNSSCSGVNGIMDFIISSVFSGRSLSQVSSMFTALSMNASGLR